MRNAILKNTMLAMLSIAPMQAIAQDAPNQDVPAQEAPAEETQATEAPAQDMQDQAGVAELMVAYEQYAEARINLTEVQADGGDVAVAASNLGMARENLSDACRVLEAPDLATCLDQYIPPEMRLPDDLAPIDIEPTPEAEAEVPVETQSEPEPVMESDPEPVMESEEAAPEANAESDAQTEVQADAEAVEEPVSEEAPVESQDEMSADDSAPELIAAYEAYAAARISSTQADAAGEDSSAAADAVLNARLDLEAICAELGAPDLAACLDEYVPAEMRLPNDLAPLEMNSGEATSEEQTQEADVQEGEQAATEGEVAPVEEQPTEPLEQVEGEETSEEDVAPVLDSAKEEPAPVPAEEAETDANAEAETDGETAVETDADAEVKADAPPPQDDAEAQAEAAPKEITSITAEEGERVSEEEKVEAAAARSAPKDAKVVQENDSDFRIVFQFNNQVIVENKDNERLEQGSDETYIERLRNGRTRETIVRADATEIVTIYNRNGDIIRRSRFAPDGREYVLVYVDETYEEDLLEWRDPALDLGPLRLDIPVSEYVLDADEADEDELVQFLDQPPLERVQRLYSINEVKRSARIRDMVRRLEVGGLTFDTAKATISTNQIDSLTNVANAMLDLLDENPAETFLIEGHTDAVGGEVYNLELSDRRAETVAVILTQAFGIPPENLATQGYGERYLKVRTQEADRRNRRVTIKRITPLVSPVARR
ncbi:OmpA family protein [Maritalea sp. S77]|uniref:OmpA family protein n=1 Tax=Maritalea sp. S77 TaxID=3415125 RepID=UPI003C7C3530